MTARPPEEVEILVQRNAARELQVAELITENNRLRRDLAFIDRENADLCTRFHELRIDKLALESLNERTVRNYLLEIARLDRELAELRCKAES